MKFLKKTSLMLFVMCVLAAAVRPMDAHAATKITISNVKSAPDSLVKGKSVSLRGIIKSNSRITKVTGKIVKSSNKKTYFSKTVRPKSYSYSLAGPIDYSLKFGRLPIGKYKYSVTVKTASGASKKVLNKTFQVVKTASRMSVKPKVADTTIMKGKGTSVYGYVKSNYKITKVTTQIVGTTYVKTAKPNAKSYNIAAADTAMKFSRLNVGTYNLKVTAKDSSGTIKSKKVSCTVTNSDQNNAADQASNSTLSVSPSVSPSSAIVGTGIFVYGRVTSNYKITSVTAEIVGTGYKKTVRPNSLSYNLSGMDSAMKFSMLGVGTYELKVTATDASGKTVEACKTVSLRGVSGNASTGQAIVDYACQFIGNPYVWAGTSLTNGADCSGFVMSVLARFGYSVPHSSYEQRKVGVAVSSLDAALPGDIICFNGHVAIYCGNGMIVHASNPKYGIVKTTIEWCNKEVIGIRRVW